ncbi:AAA family ATPase [Xanthomonas sp. AmX2]|uniref:AAA family ATPase n=1 Tax=Xanthomonas sp. TaxID=29446 RepID=UPI0019820DAE|nr:AAA family ATPase [Xanthomonas sp.]MBN6150157.1 AAA family ATPase [Xanthomonas sp.]
MKLISAHITNFRSVDDSGSFEIHGVTCLVGKNEAGKSAVLMALAALNPHPATPAVLDKERDYPRRHLTAYDQRHGGEAATAIQTTWELSDDDMLAIEGELCEGILSSNRVQISRAYAHDVSIDPPMDFKIGLNWLYDRFQLDEADRARVVKADTSSNLGTLIDGLDDRSDALVQLRKYLTSIGSLTAVVKARIKALLPRFMYFSAYDTMSGAIQIEQTLQLRNKGQLQQDDYRGDQLFVEFLDFAGVSLNEITGVQTYETFNAKLQGASNNITDQVMEYWTQNPDLVVNVDISQARPGDRPPFNTGTVARARIYNQLHRVDTPFSERSAGFVWFFSFLVKFAQVKNDEHPVVLLLDEPGLTLHGKAQADLLRFFKEKLAPHHQVVYTTHSPFMVPANDLASVLVVEDQVAERPRRTPLGTKVRSDVLSRDADTLFPLQGALGYEITQSLFVGKNTLLVEGPGDILYIHAFSEALRKRGRQGLDPRWIICPAGGIDKIRPFASLFAGNKLNIAALSDQAAGDRKKIEDLKRAQILKSGQFYTVADLLDRPEADIEDLFDPEVFATVLNDTYGLEGELRLDPPKLEAAAPDTTRLVKRAENAFKLMPPEVAEFDHFAPAAWLLRNPKVLDGKSAPVTRTLDRAEKVFKVFNDLLD